MQCSVLTILFFSACTSFAFGVNDSSSVSNYFNKVYSAEMHLITGNNEKSMELYVSAFDFGKGQKIIFLKDLHNALMLAYQNENYHYFEKFLYYLNSFDVDSSFFQSVGYENIRESGFFTLVQTFFVDKPRRDSGSSACSVFERLMVLDQSIRKACKEKYGNYYRFCGEEIALLDSLILDQLKAYFDEKGIPKESDFCNVSKGFIPAYHLLIKHNLQWCRTRIIEELKKQIGKIHPQVLADILRYTYNNPCDGSDIQDPLLLGFHLRLDSNLYILPVDSVQIVNANISRTEIYLDPIENFHQKLIFQEFNPEYVLVYTQFIPILDLNNQALEEELKKNFKEFKVIKGK